MWEPCKVGFMKKITIAMGLVTGVVFGEMSVESIGVRVVGKGYSSKEDAMSVRFVPSTGLPGHRWRYW